MPPTSCGGTEHRQIRAPEARAHGDVTRATETGVGIGIGGMRRRGRQSDPGGGHQREPLRAEDWIDELKWLRDGAKAARFLADELERIVGEEC
ncbi:hypothetical protein JQ636_21990 [Bradyrhizobium japonicum]|uniref:hypothetical protein n=1 Tax=Bradyrhizobium japonicum TaxID=375 RepID=UPI001BA85A45|nr:hypothetical protein [Bradyrhizobium japonicum]MBR0806231.1 hypothetical protein [Bradyrhizobium japonicum]